MPLHGYQSLDEAPVGDSTPPLHCLQQPGRVRGLGKNRIRIEHSVTRHFFQHVIRDSPCGLGARIRAFADTGANIGLRRWFCWAARGGGIRGFLENVQADEGLFAAAGSP